MEAVNTPEDLEVYNILKRFKKSGNTGFAKAELEVNETIKSLLSKGLIERVVDDNGEIGYKLNTSGSGAINETG